MTPASGDLNTHLVLRRLSVHLSVLAENIKQIEDATSGLLETAAEPAESLVIKLQSLDFTRQSLEDCSALVELMSGTAVFGDTSALTARLKLDSTKSLLSCEADPADTKKSGEFDAF